VKPNIAFTVREGVGGLKRGRFHSAIAAVATALAVSLLGMFLYGALNLRAAAQNFLGSLQFEAFISLSLPTSGHDALRETLRQMDRRLSVTYVSREEAASRFAAELDPDLFNVLGENPLPASFKIGLPGELMHPDSAEALAARLSALDGIDEVIYDQQLLNLLHSGIGKLTIWGMIFGSIATLLAVALTFNSVRIKIDAQRDKVRLMSLLGAQPLTLRTIFWIQGLILGAIGGAVSSGVIAGFAALLQYRLASGIEIIVPHAGLPFLAGCLLGMSGGLIAVGKYLKV
jgi:cell division transport system permease protein